MFTARWLQDALDGRQSFGIGFRLCGSRRLRRASTQPNLRASMIGWYISATQYGWRNQPQSQSADGPREIRRDQTEMRAAHGHVRRPNQPEVIASNMLTPAGIELRVETRSGLWFAAHGLSRTKNPKWSERRARQASSRFEFRVSA